MEELDLTRMLIEIQHDHTVLEKQGQFPEEDLTDRNAAFLDNFLQDELLVNASHPHSEQQNSIFKMAHRAVAAEPNLLDNANEHASFSQGFTYYEIMSELVSPEVKDPLHDHVALVAAESLMVVLRGDRQSKYLMDAVEEFSDKQPQAASVIENAARRVHRDAVIYTLMGAAVERRIELETKAFQDKFQL